MKVGEIYGPRDICVAEDSDPILQDPTDAKDFLSIEAV
jgi:hypothetical protein